MNEEYEALRNTDPFREAELITGKSYKECTETEAIGVLLHIQTQAIKKQLLESMNDTHHGINPQTFRDLLCARGFSCVFCEYYPESNHTYLEVWWQSEKNILLHFTTFRFEPTSEERLNGGTFHYVRKFATDNEGKFPKDFYSESGGCDDPNGETLRFQDLWINKELYHSGWSDCREGMFHKIELLEKEASWVKPWPKLKPGNMLYICHYSKYKDMGWPETSDILTSETERVLFQLPKEVQDAIGYKGRQE